MTEPNSSHDESFHPPVYGWGFNSIQANNCNQTHDLTGPYFTFKRDCEFFLQQAKDGADLKSACLNRMNQTVCNGSNDCLSKFQDPSVTNDACKFALAGSDCNNPFYPTQRFPECSAYVMAHPEAKDEITSFSCDGACHFEK